MEKWAVIATILSATAQRCFGDPHMQVLSECERDRSYILTESELSTCDVIEQTPLCF